MPKLSKQCPNGHRAGSNSQKTCRTCGHRFYKKRSSPVVCTKVCPSCKVRVRGNNTKICKRCSHIFTKREQNADEQPADEQPVDEQMEVDFESFLALISTDDETTFRRTMSKAGIDI